MSDAREVVVVGGTSGIGEAIAHGFAALENHRVIAAGLLPEPISPAGAASNPVPATPGSGGSEVVPGRVSQLALDVRDAANVERFFAALERLDVLVNCAGIIRRDGAEFDEEGFTAVVDVNLAGTMRCARAARPLLAARGGCIVNTASMLTYFGSGAVPAYAASKGAIGQLTRSLAIAWAADGIRVNAIVPGWIGTELTRALEGDEVKSAAILARTPMGRWGTPEDLVGPTLFLASEAAAFVTGALLTVDGGYSAA